MDSRDLAVFATDRAVQIAIQEAVLEAWPEPAPELLAVFGPGTVPDAGPAAALKLGSSPSELEATAADEVAIWPLQRAELRLRIARAFARYGARDAFARGDLPLLLELAAQVNRASDLDAALPAMARGMARALDCDDCSIAIFDGTNGEGYIAARAGEPGLIHEPIPPAALAEARLALVGEAPRLLQSSTGLVALFPVRVEGPGATVVQLSGFRAKDPRLDPRQLMLAQILAHTAAITIRNQRLLQSARERVERVSSESIRIERRLRHLEKYQSFFELAGDGIVVVDARGRFLFANQEAERILGLSREDLTHLRLNDVAAPAGAEQLAALLGGFARHEARQRADLTVLRGDGSERILAISAAALDSAEDWPGEAFLAIMSIRDVTDTRRLAADLARTKDFLENVIESSGEAVIAADMCGKIIIFNPVAERITGHKQQDVVGKMSVEQLYPNRMAREMMRRLRSPEYGESGRYQSSREELLTRDGQRVPISIAAAVVYHRDEPGREVATVGLFSDLRERLRLEEELLHAQQKLELSERQAAILELAGTFAHELNQPLTAILGSSELMLRRLAPGPERTAFERIGRECDRMEEILKRLSQVAAYKTKPYLGLTNILDIDAASGEEEA